jgi:hypothetical protein
MAKSPFAIDPELTAVAIAYKNDSYIGDMVAPRRTVGKEEFQWDEYTTSEMYTIPDTKVGRLSAPNQVTFSSTRNTESTQDYGLDAPVPQKDIDNADANRDPKAHATMGVMELVMLDREKRLADVVDDLNTYAAAHKDTLSGTDQFSDYTNSDPLSYLLGKLDIPLMRPNKMEIGQEAWTVLRTHPVLVEAVVGTGAAKGAITREQLAQLLELEEVLVGRSRANAAKPGQTMSLYRLWGKHITMFYSSPLSELTSATQIPTFMLTAQFGTQVAGEIVDPDMGLKGGVKIRAGESVKEVKISDFCAFHVHNAVA